MNKTKRTEAEQQELLCYIREHYEYEPERGALRNKRQGTVQKGSKRNQRNYLKVMIHWKGKLTGVAMHHAVWVLNYGCWPTLPLDHIDGDVTNNHIENLRECSQSENNLNTQLPWKPNAQTGVPGVDIRRKKYRGKIRGKHSLFYSPFEAFCIATLCGKRYR